MRKSIQHMLFLALCLLLPSISRAAALSVEEAKDVASEFFQSGANHRLADKDALVLAYTAVDESSQPISYVFNAKDGKGFVIVSADENAMPVIGYSDVDTWSVNSMPGAAQGMISAPVEISADIRLKSALMHAEGDSKLLSTPSWSQEAPFNNKIPNRRLTGCVGVALAEILKYHGVPAARPASLATDGVTSYDWANMRDDNYRSGYTQEEGDAVATLVADAAIGIGTDFGMSSSSAYEVKVPYALTFLFGYDAGVSYKKRSELSKSVWDQIIVNEINENRPVLYSGQDVSAGHAFVCDGYEIRGGVAYFHINWGWGGSANGYYASDALNPVVSKQHSYNDLMTIIYNIKPAASATAWSDIHVTSDERQVGLTLDVADISSADSFSVRAGALKNISNTDFSGKLAVALFDAAGKQKALLNDGRNFNLVALQIQKSVDFSCKIPSGVSVADGDVVRLVTMAGGSSEWLPVSGDLLAPGEASATHYAIPYFYVTLPAESSDYEVVAASDKVVKGRDYTFTVKPLSADKVITVKANGFILTPNASNGYTISNVLEDQKIDIIVQNAADVLTKSTLWVTAGNLQNLLTEQETATIKDLTLFGTINVNDFNFMRDRMKLNRLDISQVSILASGSNPANAIPTKAFMGYRSLQTLILPNNLNTFKNGCLAQTGLTSIDIPASVATWEYNVFVGCNQLREVIARRSAPAWINWCVFNGTPQTKLIVPVGAAAAYKAKEYWQDFKEIEEGVPAAPTTFSVTVSEKKGLKFTLLTEGVEFNSGDKYDFKVETDNSFEDAIMQVYANSTCLSADSEGVYHATINGNTLIHVEFKQPQPTTADKTWKLTGDAGGIGLVSEVVNVPVGKTFTVRANAIKVPAGDDAAKFYGLVLTDKNGAIKEFISSIVSNYYSRDAANLTYNFYCQVKEATVNEGNQIRLATSYNKKDWQLVEAEADTISDRLSAIGNQVIYHNVVMPSSVTGAKIEGGATQVVRGMPFSVKVSAINPAQRVTVSVNGQTKATNVAIANVSIPAVLEDLDITVTVKDADAGDYMVYNIQEGQLASKLVDCPGRVKLIGTMLVNDFNALRANASVIIDLDMADVTIKGAAMTGNSIPENAFAPTSAGALSALRTVILPNNLERIDKNAFARCTQITELTIPANVSYIGEGAFSACTGLKKIIAKPKVAPVCGNMSPFPSNPSQITLEVPKGSEDSYSVASTWWSQLSLYRTPADAKEYYWVKLNDPSRISVNSNVNLNKIEVGSSDVYVELLLPNNQSPSQFKGTLKNSQLRPGVAFKLYDNGVDVFNNVAAYTYERVSPNQLWSMIGGRLALRWVKSATSGPWMPQNHEVEVVFYYSINFENEDGVKDVEAQIVEMPVGCEWKNVAMSTFEWQVKSDKGNYMVNNTEVKPVLYREGSEIKFTLSDPGPKTELVVNLMTKVMTKTGADPVYEEREMTLESQNGIYTIPALEGDTWIRISGINHYEEGDPIPANDLGSLDKESVLSFTELTVTGDLDAEDFSSIRDKFEALETIDLSETENTSLPENAFEGMDNLKDVIVSENVTEIGAGCFKDCTGIETLTLPGVTSIGEGAFEGCDNLTSILLPSLGNTENKPGLRRANAADGVNAESFKGLNPNCLIYVGSAEIPDAESLNIILNKGGQRVAASDIVLDGNHSFNAPASFLLGDHRISFTMDITASDSCDVDGGWKTLMLPFQPTGMEFGEQFGEREGSGIHILSFDGEEAETMTAQKEILPNRPYLANVCAPYASVPVTFYASAREQAEGEDVVYDVPFTPVPEDLVAVGKEFSLYGSYDGQTRPVVCYALNEDASKFFRPADNENVAVNFFSAYLVANEGTAKTEIAIGEHPLWIHEPATAAVVTPQLYRSTPIDMASITRKASVYYTVDGTDPTVDGTRKLFTEPFTMEEETLNIKAVAEYKGYVSDVVELNYELKKANVDYNLVQNWNWISHNAESAVAVSTFATDGIERILSQTQEAIADPKLGLVGNLTEIAPAVGYKVYVGGESWKGNVSGVAFDPIATIKLHKGWNWIGSGVSEGSLLISDLLSALEVEEGDMLVGLDGFVQVDGEGNWAGTISHMVPGEGYMFLSNSDKEFAYTITPAEESKAAVKKAPVAASESYWTVDNHKYASVMPIVAELTLNNGCRVDADDYRVAAFCGDECRGIGEVVNGAVMINVHGNAGDQISFRIINALDEEKVSVSAISFNENKISTFAAPVAINVENTTSVESIEVAPFTVISENGAIIFGGDVASVQSVEIYDVTGMLLTKSANADKVEGLGTGVVIVVVRTESGIFYQKVLVK